MKILKRLLALAVVSVFLPGVAFAHPDMSNRKDVQRILYATFLDAFYEGNNELEQKFHDRRTYVVNITSNKLFVNFNAFSVLSEEARKGYVVRFEAATKLLGLWALRPDEGSGLYKPKFNRFKVILEILETAVENEKFLIKKAVSLAKDAKAFDPVSYTDSYAVVFGHEDGDDALLTADLTTLGNALIADINARKKSKEINKAYVNDVDHLFDGKNSEAKMKKAHLPDMQRNRYIQHYTLNVDKADLTTFSLTDAGIKVTPELGDTVPTTDNGGGNGGNGQSPLADQAIEKFSNISAVFNNDPTGFLNLILLPGSGQNTTNREFLNLLRPATIYAINQLKLGADLANKSIQANEPKAAQATADLQAITDQLLAIKEKLNLTNNNINPSFEITQAEFGTAAIPDPTNAKGLLDQAAALFVGAIGQSSIEGYQNLMQLPSDRVSVVEGVIRTAIRLYNKAKVLDDAATAAHPLADLRAPNLQGLVNIYNANQVDSKDITGFAL